MKKLRTWLAGESGKRFFNIAYSLGAAVVIIGAMFKVMHYPGANVIFVTGMIVEAAIFFLSAFDTSLYDNAPVTVARNIQVSDQAVGEQINATSTTVNSNTNVVSATNATSTQSAPNATGGSQVYIVGGGGGSTSSGAVASGGSTSASTSASVVSGAIPTEGLNVESAKGYNESMTTAAQNVEEFSKTMQSLNETSQNLLGVYKQIADASSLTESMNTVRYINDSLARIKSQYDSAIGDSYMFKEEMSKMTRHIESLNQVYARLLQAMTSNNNPNHNNPPTY